MSKSKDPAVTLEAIATALEQGGQRMDSMEASLRRLMRGSKTRALGFRDPSRPTPIADWIRALPDGGPKSITLGRNRWNEGALEALPAERALTSATITNIPEEYQADVIEELGARMVVVQSGATQRTNLQGSPYRQPRISASATAAWVAEDSAATPSNPTMDEVNATPEQLIGVSEFTRLAHTLSNPDLEAVIREHLTRVLGRKSDATALEGSGSGEPAGVSSWATDHPINGVPDFDNTNDMLEVLETANADVGSIGWIMHPRDYNVLRKTKDSTGQYLIQPAVSQGEPPTLHGYPVRKSTQISIVGGVGTNEGTIYLGNWADFLWLQWGAIELMVSDEASDYWLKNKRGVRALVYQQFDYMHAASFVKGTGVTTS